MALLIAANHRYTPTSVGTDKGALYRREANMGKIWDMDAHATAGAVQDILRQLGESPEVYMDQTPRGVWLQARTDGDPPGWMVKLAKRFDADGTFYVMW